MNQLEIQIDGGRTEFEPGETIVVHLNWSLPEPPESLKLQLVWNTIGKGTTDRGLEKTIAIDASGREGTHRVELTLPAAPYSFSGKLVSLVWALELMAKRPRAEFRTEMTIAPGRSEILLHKDEASQSGTRP